MCPSHRRPCSGQVQPQPRSWPQPLRPDSSSQNYHPGVQKQWLRKAEARRLCPYGAFLGRCCGSVRTSRVHTSGPRARTCRLMLGSHSPCTTTCLAWGTSFAEKPEVLPELFRGFKNMNGVTVPGGHICIPKQVPALLQIQPPADLPPGRQQ